MKGIIKEKKRSLFLILTLCLLFSSFNINIAIATDQEQPDDEKETIITTYQGKECVDGEVLVRFSNDQSGGMIQNTLYSLDSTIQASLPNESLVVTSIPEGDSMEDFIAELESISNVEYVQPNYFYRLHRTVNDPGAQTPDPDQWHLDTINANEVWDITMGSADVTVAVLDTGVDLDHPDLAGQIYMHTDTVDNDNDANDDDGHGTHVSGIIAAATNNGLGVAGIAPGVKLIVADVFGWYLVETSPGVYENTFGALTSEIIEGIEYATANGADVINMSLGGYEYDMAYEAAIDDAVGAGAVVVASAGNDGKDEYDETEGVSTKCYPADFDSCISVIWTNEDDTRNPNSNYGPSKDIAAPGNAILSTYWQNDDPDWEYALLSGTSMAAPVVTGVIALMLSVNPDLTVDEVKDILYSTATDLGDSGRDDEYGHGRVNAQAAVQAALDAIVIDVTGVTLSKTEIEVMVGDTDWLIAVVDPEEASDPTVTWSSEDENIATVVEGIVTGIETGSTTITATTVDGGFTASCDVNVIPHQTSNAFNDLGFIPLDMALDPDRPVAFLTEKDGYLLYRVDLTTGNITSMNFPYKAERLTVKNGKVYLTLPHHSHTRHLDSDGYGSIGVIDTQNFTLDKTFDVVLDPYDIEADNEGRVYIGPGSGQTSIVASYDSGTGELISTRGEYYQALWDYNKHHSKLYSISQNLSPRDIQAYEITDGEMTASYGSPYHGDYSLTNDITISSDGQYIFNGSGNLFTCSSSYDGDMIYDGTLGSSFTSICFDLNSNMFYTSNGSTLTAYNYDTRVQKYTYTMKDEFKSIHYNGDTITALCEKSTGELYIDRISVHGQNADLSTLNISTGVLGSTFDKDIIDYSLIMDANDESVTVTCTAADSGALVQIEGEDKATKTIDIANGGLCIVPIKVTSEDGFAEKTYTLRIYRNSADNTFIQNSSNFRPYDQAASPFDNAIYMTGIGQNYLYKIDYQGDLFALRLPSIAQNIGFSEDSVFVTLFDPLFDVYSIGIIDLENFTLVDTFAVDLKLNGAAGDAERIYVSSSGRIDVHSRTTLEKLSENSIGNDVFELNRVNGVLYAVNRYSIRSYSLNGNQLELQQEYEPFFYTDESLVEVMPDGLHLIYNNCTIMTCSNIAEDDLQVVDSFYTHSSIGLESGLPWVYNVLSSSTNSNEIYGVIDRIINVYDASDYSFKRAITEPEHVESVMCAGDYTFIGISDGEHSVLHAVCPSALLKTMRINGDMFSEFYPTHFDIDRGEVPYAMTSVLVEVEAASDNASVSGDIGLQTLEVGENTLQITVTDPHSGCSETYTLSFNRRSSDPPTQTYNAFNYLGFEPLDMAVDTENNTAYITEKDGYSLYKINLVTGEISSKTFDIKVERLTVKNGKIYVTLPRHVHGYSTYGEGYGAIAVINCETLVVEFVFNVMIDPYDIEADSEGYVYISPGSNSHSSIASFNSVSGELIGSQRRVYDGSLLDFNELYNRLYSISQGVIPRDINAYWVSEGKITAEYDSPYHGDYPMDAYMRVSPDGHYIFNGSGNIFNCTPTPTGDIAYNGSLGSTFSSICFNLDNNTFFTANGKTLTVYDYDTREVRYQHTSMDEYIDIYFDDGELIALQKNSSDEYFIRVEEIIPVTGVQLDQETMDLLIGENGTLTELVTPVNATNSVVEWSSSDEAVAIVVDGVVTAINGGTALITVTTVDGGFTDTCEVTVTQNVEGVSLNKEELNLTIGGTETLVATIVPENATNKNITWVSSDESVATVVDGVVTALSLGNTIVTVTTEDGDYKDTCIVRVAIPVTAISLNKSSINLIVGESEMLIETISPSDATNQNVAWTSSNEGVALVDGNGNVSAISTGTSTITVTTEDGGYTAQCMVHVTQPVIGVSLDQISLDINVGSTVELIPTVEPENASNKSVAWSSSNEDVCTVINGMVTAQDVGETTITVTTDDGGYTANCTVNVTQKVTGVELNKTELMLAEGESGTLSANVSPSDATNKIVTWASSNTNVATVDQSGFVTAVGAGEATITATADGVSDTCAVMVKEMYTDTVIDGKLNRTYFNWDGSIDHVVIYYGSDDSTGIYRIYYYEDGVQTSYEEYNTSGNIISKTYLYSSGVKKKTYWYSTTTGKQYAISYYSTSGKIMHKTYLYSSGVKKRTYWYSTSTGKRYAISEYNTSGKITEKTYLYSSGVKRKTYWYNTTTGKKYAISEYNTSGKITQKTYLYSNGVKRKTYWYSSTTGKRYAISYYNTSGKITQKTYLYASGVKKRNYWYSAETGKRYAISEYNTSGKITEKTYLYSNGVKRKTYWYSTSTGKRYAISYYGTNGKITHKKYLYTSGVTKKTYWYSKTTGKRYAISYYDTNGDITKKVYYNSDGSVKETIYY